MKIVLDLDDLLKSCRESHGLQFKNRRPDVYMDVHYNCANSSLNRLQNFFKKNVEE